MSNDDDRPDPKALARFQELDYDAFRKLAQDSSLSANERIGFPDSYRAGKEEAILADICGKLPLLGGEGRTVVDIGPGCARLAHMIIDLCRERGHELILIDSPEMLQQLPDAPFIKKITGLFPRECSRFVQEMTGKVDVLLSYSVLHYILKDYPLFDFLDICAQLLAPRGEMLLGDIPNVSQRKRFFSSETGRSFHRHFTKTDTEPSVEWNKIERWQFDDALLFALVARARAAGFDAYLLPQDSALPMSNRREDLLVRRP